MEESIEEEMRLKRKCDKEKKKRCANNQLTAFSVTITIGYDLGWNKKHSTPLYCYWRTITYTRFPNFFADRRPQILPRPSFTSEVDQKGSNFLKKSSIQMFLYAVEYHVLHYLHNLCLEPNLKKKIFLKNNCQKDYTTMFITWRQKVSLTFLFFAL